MATPNFPFRVLVVDNDRDVLISAKEQSDELDYVETTTVASGPEAKKEISRGYFHLAVVDLRLTDDFASGMDVLQTLRELSPSCVRVAMTRLAAREPDALLRVVNPLEGLVQGVVDKQVRRHNAGMFGYLIESYMRTIDAPSLDLDGLDEIASAVWQSRRISQSRGKRSKEALTSELETVLRRLFGGRVPSAQDMAAAVRVRLAEQGFSGAVAFTAIPVLARDPERLGAQCFVKVGAKTSIDSEVARFRDHVQLNIPLRFRVELLGHAQGDVLSAVAYSFAGGSTSEIASLDRVVKAEGIAPQVITTIEKLFNVQDGRWYSVAGPPRAIGGYFEAELRSNYADRLPALKNSCRNLANRLNAQYDAGAGTLIGGTTRLSIPTDGLVGRGYLSRARPTCLVHGDMHGGNVLVNAEDEVYLIDFAHAGFGPQALDAAVLHGSIRLWDSARLKEVPDLWNELGSIVQREATLAQQWASKPRASSGAHPWEVAASTVDKGLRANFESIDAEDVLWVYLLQAARLSTLPFDDYSRLRLFAWFTAVKASLDVD